MKLQLTATSERGKSIIKTGNDYLKLEVRDENREVISTIRFDIKKDDLGELIAKSEWTEERVYRLDK
jgi:hypothetical protein